MGISLIIGFGAEIIGREIMKQLGFFTISISGTKI